MTNLEMTDLDLLRAEIEAADEALRSACVAISEYPNLRGLERNRDAAKQRFARALSEYANLKEKLHKEVVYVAGVEQR